MRAYALSLLCLAIAVSAFAAEVHVPGNITAEATGPQGAEVTYSVTGMGAGGDDHNGRPIKGPNCSPASGSTFAVGATTVTCTATDAAGTDSKSFTITVTDTTPPVLFLPGTINSTSAVVFYDIAGKDLVDGWRIAVCSPASGSTFPVGTTTVNCTVSDSRGNQSSGSFAVVVTASQPPTLNVPNDMTVEATSAAGAVVTYTATANSASGTGQDDFNGRPSGGGGSITPSCAPASGSTFALGTTTVTCTASDSGGTTTRSFNVTVVDTTAPALSLPGNITTDQTTVTWTATATDLVDGSVPVDCSPASGSTFALGTTTVDCSASDSRGNSSSGSFTVTVFAPQPPTLTVPDDMTVEATGPEGALVEYTATAGSGSDQDDENGRPIGGGTQANCTPPSGSIFPLGTTTVTCTASNAAGSVSDSFTVTVVDTTAPALDLPRDFSMKATSADGAVVGWTAFATDLVDGPVPATCTPHSGSTFPAGTTHVTCTATDAHDNTATGGFNVTITPPDQPPPPPTLDLPDDITAEATGPDGAIVTFTVTSTGGGGPDDFNGRPTNANVVCAPASGSLFPLGTTTVQCTAGTASGAFLVHVVDTTAPDLTLPDDITTDQTTVTWTATATDVVDGDVAVTCTPASGSTFAAGTTIVHCSATDAHNNTATGSFAVTVNDPNQPGRTITLTATPDTLWPPDKKMVQVTIFVEISDDSPFVATIATVSSSENDPNDNTSPDWVITGPLTLNLRAEKSAQAQTRVYTITVEVTDDANVTHIKTVKVTVVNPNA